MKPPLPTVNTLAGTLHRYADELPPGELPALLGALEAAKGAAWARLMSSPERKRDRQDASGAALLNAKDMAERLGIAESWLRDAARNGRIPCVRVGRYMRFDPPAVLRAVKGSDSAAAP